MHFRFSILPIAKRGFASQVVKIQRGSSLRLPPREESGRKRARSLSRVDFDPSHERASTCCLKFGCFNRIDKCVIEIFRYTLTIKIRFLPSIYFYSKICISISPPVHPYSSFSPLFFKRNFRLFLCISMSDTRLFESHAREMYLFSIVRART